MESLIDEAWRLYHESGPDSPVVKPSIPIVYFGDRERYLRSPIRVSTVALIPSRKEFPDADRFARFRPAETVYSGILDGRYRDEYVGALNAYFREKPSRSWFGWFEEVLIGMGTKASIGRLGDERVGLSIVIEMNEEEFFDELQVGVGLIRKDHLLQMLMGVSTGGPLRAMADIAEQLDSRWPSRDLWDMVPELDDMPAGMTMSSERTYEPS